MSLFDVDPSDGAQGDLLTADGLRRLLVLPGVGPRGAVRIAQRFWTSLALADADVAELGRLLPRADPSTIDALANLPDVADLPSGVRALSLFDDDWPEWAVGIPNAPAVLYVRGTVPRRPALAVVGTRSPTDYGLSVVRQVVNAAAAHEYGIVSGLAFGIDAAAHTAALDAGAPTWAVLGGGVDKPTPPVHAGLAEQILEAGGGLIAEVPPGTRPNPQRLVARNRLQVAASNVVVAAQCGIPSGTLHTVRFAIEQKRRLVVPRPTGRWTTEEASAGNMALTDPSGCSPAVLNASGRLAKVIQSRRPVADVVLGSGEDVDKIWE